MTEGIIIAIIGLLSGTGVGGWALIRSRRKDKAEAEAQEQVVEEKRQAAFTSRFDDANELTDIIAAKVEEAVAPIRKELAEFKAEHEVMTSEFRIFFTRLWMWDSKGRLGPMPTLPNSLLESLQLSHLIGLDQTDPKRIDDA